MTAFFGAINFARSWTTAWTAISDRSSSLSTVLVVIGAVAVVFAVVEYIRESRRGGGSRRKLIYTLAVAIIFFAPGVVVPAILIAVDFIINTGLGPKIVVLNKWLASARRGAVTARCGIVGSRGTRRLSGVVGVGRWSLVVGRWSLVVGVGRWRVWCLGVSLRRRLESLSKSV